MAAVGIRDLKTHASEILERAEAGEAFLVTRRGKPVAVVLPFTVDAEDFPVCLDIQRGFGAGAQLHITFGRNEPALGHYHRSLRQVLGLSPS